MDKKDLKFYETPAVEVLEFMAEGQLLASSLDPDESSLPNPDENMED